ncbi:MAG TPA: acetyl-CoA carboxylase biotin carboxylase subunit [Chitinophagales bacterium]|nr:acetyl-CoA carboxylase biotin carboxylase subunit [Chitinophagales bacterium]HNK74487.1 acetyl-CoA carboxylase biotin carboxylase subunit [Chitinophagales bacterium]
MKKILIANRGEIALRVMRTCKQMGISTVAIYSEADRNSPHVRFADEAVCVGAATSKESYLKIDTIIEVCKSLQVDGVHPGYGFLSENAVFAKACKDNGITFIGPSVEAIEIMGSKLAAKQAVSKFDVPLVPGTDQPISDINEAKNLAEAIGFPILIKASAGGGGKGMRIVNNVEEFEEQMKLAVSEATSAFGDGSVFIEKFVTSPRHIEIQILGDTHGNIVHLFERDCSVQRRHQKVVEEAPSAVLTPALRKQMGEAAVQVAKSVNYIGAGTVEFIVNANLDFYFLEMNTRLQVEHPVTEMITGIDLVKEQINIARGEKISFGQDDLKIQGHAIELRVYAEDPENNFLPDIGKLEAYQIPKGEGIRVDDGFDEGMDIPIYYDPMIAKLIAHGSNRKDAIEKLKKAIIDYNIVGVKTTLPFGEFVLHHSAFTTGNFDTKFVDNYYHPSKINKTELTLATLIAAKLFEEKGQTFEHVSEGNIKNETNWKNNRME